MTTEEKAKRYNEALERAREWYNETEPDSYTCIVESIFPELKESKDEKIRKEIISAVNIYCSEYSRGTKVREDMLAWLEKQGKQKPEWGEEDNQMFIHCVAVISSNSLYEEAEKEKLYDWLKSLRPHKQWKPSEWQLNALNVAIAYMTDETETPTAPKVLTELLEQLKAL